MTVQYNNQNLKLRRFYFSGTTVLRKGQVLSFKASASLPDASATDDRKLEYGNNVVITDGTNLVPAGIVDDSSVGKTGPCYVDLIIPEAGNVLQVEVDGTTDIAVADALEVDPAGTLGAYIKDAAVAATVPFRCIALEAFTTDATKAAKWVRFY